MFPEDKKGKGLKKKKVIKPRITSPKKRPVTAVVVPQPVVNLGGGVTDRLTAYSKLYALKKVHREEKLRQETMRDIPKINKKSLHIARRNAGEEIDPVELVKQRMQEKHEMRRKNEDEVKQCIFAIQSGQKMDKKKTMKNSMQKFKPFGRQDVIV